MLLVELAIGSAPFIAGMGAAWATVASGKQERERPCGCPAKWQPPSWVFRVVWPLLYILLGVVGVRIWQRTHRMLSMQMVSWTTLVAAIVLWWPVFNIWCNPTAAFGTLVVIALGSLYVAAKTRMWLLLSPLCTWLAFASVLSFQVMRGICA